MGTLGSRPLVTARVMRAARFSWSSSISRSFFATSPSILAVSRSRNAAICSLLVPWRHCEHRRSP